MVQPIRSLVYSRVSTDAQERDGTSLDTQEQACVDFARAQGWYVIECVRDTASGFNLDRPGIERTRMLLRQGEVDVVLSYAVDRLSRNQNHIGVLFDEIERTGSRFEFVTEKFEDTAIGRFILAARAFIGEVEREKIAERTMRGKEARARSGRIPQGTGRGCYGYRYKSETGHREEDPFQATVVQRIFQLYAETRSFSAVSLELNEAGIPAFSGGRWYPLTIRRIVTNESYTGRFIYRRTKRVRSVRSGIGKGRSKVIAQPVEEWIEVKDACPRIIDQGLWERVQAIINDPERTKCLKPMRFYPLRGRARCSICGSAMVGQTLTVKGKAYAYYRCRHVYDKNTGRECTARYVRADALEKSIWAEIKRVLSSPEIVLRELTRQSKNVENGQSDRKKFEKEVEAIAEQEKRLTELYSLGYIGQDAIRERASYLAQKRKLLEDQLMKMSRHLPRVKFSKVEERRLRTICRQVEEWIDKADASDRLLALEALQVAVTVDSKSGEMTGVLPIETPEFIMDNQISPCSCSGS